MLQALAKRRNDDRGFTLIELMIVVLIIGILLAVGFPTFLGAQRRAQDRAAQALLATSMTAAKVYFTDANKYYIDATHEFNEAAAEAIEPSVDFAASGSVGIVGISGVASATPTTVTLTTISASTRIFCMKDSNGSITYGNAASGGTCTPSSGVQSVGWTY